MKLATFNVNGVNGRLPVLLRWLDETAPDIVCLQELKAPQDKFSEGPIRDAGYGAIWHGQKSWNGVAILVRAAGFAPINQSVQDCFLVSATPRSRGRVAFPGRPALAQDSKGSNLAASASARGLARAILRQCEPLVRRCI